MDFILNFTLHEYKFYKFTRTYFLFIIDTQDQEEDFLFVYGNISMVF